MKGLEALEELRNEIRATYFDENNKQLWTTDKSKDYRCNIIEKELKALEIIKISKIKGLTLEWDGIWWTVNAPNYLYPIAYGRKKEEYDLLKEVLL